MLSSFVNPWFTVATDPLWAVRQATETAARCLDADLLADPRTLVRHCSDPAEQRLNPFDFHGRRRVAARQPAGEGHVGVSRSRKGRRAA